ncbi:chromosome segregation protein SMC [Microaerobacter geothermalis]|uniref:chromosome segregation protein SMC n=1 Tax=Microaerobacter geothermalis TaxID=674972 RepID=UPI001F357E2D|nr:chromosome segregation protein SMC [Microaerobacter geothermalis]MCF6094353.1 chromosome segregation protein SMC [Microaerobacter geothermalis]
MYLKRIELFGFKSFADRTELEFVPGITAVVGPNGSGKSNISDGIRWVLGEQSAKSLRGSKMEDVIFAGSEQRKPVNYCEVSLTLDNTDQSLDVDYTEVTVTRRVYRSGESEYMINRQTCRLKDITELFMDTGVGKEAYSIIGQGRIEEILSTKSEDRRGIFEEAAGIVKFKTRKKEALRKLEDTEQNLLRILDIIADLEEQIEPLQIQAEEAQTYKSIKKELTEKDISLYVYMIEDVNQKLEQSTKAVSLLQEEQILKSTQLQQKEAHVESLRHELQKLENQVEENQKKLLEISQWVEKKEGQQEVFKEGIKHYSRQIEEVSQRILRLTDQLSAAEMKTKETQDASERVKDDLEQLNKRMQHEEELLHSYTSNLTGELEELKTNYIECLNTIASTRNDIRNCEQQVASIERKEEKISQDIHHLNGEAASLEKQAKEVDFQIKALSAQLEQCIDQYKKIVAHAREITMTLEEKRTELKRVQQRIHTLRSRKEVLEEMEADFSGFFQGVKEVLKARNHPLSGIEGAIAELIHVPKPYETAIETALGGALQHIVVIDEAAGREAISFLKKNQFGRATFLPMDVMKGREMPQEQYRKLKDEPGFVGIASHLIKYKEIYHDVITHLLGLVLVTKTLEDANRLAWKTGYRFRIVTLDGDVVNPGGSMTGGFSKQKSVNLLGRKREIEQIQAELKGLEEEEIELGHAILQLSQLLSEKEKQQEELRSEGESLRMKERDEISKQREVEISIKNVQERIQLLHMEIDGFHMEKDDLLKRKEQLEGQLQEKVEEEVQIKKNIEMLEEKRKESEGILEEKKEKITDLKIKYAETAKVKEQLDSDYARLLQEKEHILTEMREAKEVSEKYKRSILEHEKQIEELKTHLKQDREHKMNIEQELNQQKQTRTTILRQIDGEEGEVKSCRRELRKIEEKLHDSEVKANRYEVELDNLLENLREEYGLTYEMAKNRYPKVEDVALTKKKVSQLKYELQQLGEVNLGAIEEFERVSERYQFLTTQRDDLLEAKKMLYQVLREIDEEMSKRFMETFYLIKEQFQQVFAQLFGGGTADLLLSDPDNLLETGIDIVAQPPGKKLQNLALLSGGERALTAIALLFAILKVKPVPFCVLDEVEAALDEANVSRFAEYLREFSGQTQFIVVTHRKGTMEEADVLYGVTMQESGVSSLVSVKLEEKERIISA